MKRQEPIQIGKLIEQAIADAGNTELFDRQRVCFLWPEAVGPTINRFTTARWVTRDELHVTIASAAIKSELGFMSDAIVARLNELAGTAVIRRLIIH